jgi:ABC-type uncharacterized transport system substrate-binding protein
MIQLISLVAAAVLILVVPARAQQRDSAVIGFLTSGSMQSLDKRWIDAFHRGLGESHYIEGQNLTIEYRAADDNYDRLDAHASELVRTQVSVIIAAGGPVSALAAKRATSSIPIVFTTIADPVKSGVVDTLGKPGGNATGTAGLTSELDVKRLELLKVIKPRVRTIGVLINPKRPGVEANSKELRAAADAMGLQLVFQNAGPNDPLDAAFEALVRENVDGLVVTADPFFNFRRAQVVALATRYSIPAIYQWREFVSDGGLMSYGPSIAEAYYQTGLYAGRLLRGAQIKDLPVVQPRKFELVINLKTAKTLGLDIARRTIARIDELID